MIDTSQLTTLQAFPDGPPAGHVSIAPLDPALLEEWVATRGTSSISPLAQGIINAIVGTTQVP